VQNLLLKHHVMMLVRAGAGAGAGAASPGSVKVAFIETEIAIGQVCTKIFCTYFA